MFRNVLMTIGNTPLVRINNIINKPGIEVYAKLEGCNPTGSTKDRIAYDMIKRAEASGQLHKGKIILEATSGNTGIAVAMVGRSLGYDVLIVMSSGVSIERRSIIKAYGGKILLTDPTQGSDGAIRKCREMLKEEPEKYYNLNQYGNENNYIAHYKTATEIWEATEGKVTHIVCTVGTSGTIMGVSKKMKELNPEVKIVEVQPSPKHRLQGLRNMDEQIVPDIYDPSLVDQHMVVGTEESYAMAKRIVAEESLFVGMSSGSALLATKRLCETLESGYVVVIFPDRGEKYLSTGIFDSE